MQQSVPGGARGIPSKSRVDELAQQGLDGFFPLRVDNSFVSQYGIGEKISALESKRDD
jgi:hypothetical protein